DVAALGYRPNNAFDMLAWAAERRGVPASFSVERTLPDILAELAAGRPVIVSGSFTQSGHIVLIIGATVDGDLIVHDPWGDWMDDYRSQDGRARIYERDRVLRTLKAPDSERKWGLFVGGAGA